MRAYGEMEQHGKYTLEDFGGWSRNYTKTAPEHCVEIEYNFYGSLRKIEV